MLRVVREASVATGVAHHPCVQGQSFLFGSKNEAVPPNHDRARGRASQFPQCRHQPTGFGDDSVDEHGVGFDRGGQGQAYELAAEGGRFAGAESASGAAQGVGGSLEAGVVAAGGGFFDRGDRGACERRRW
jgi:hypothetical protein